MECLTVIHLNLLLIGDEEYVHGLYIQSKRPLIILVREVGHEVVGEFASMDREILFTCFVCDAVSDFAAEHHLITLHKVNHNILKLRHTIVHLVEEDFIFRDDLDSDVTFDEVDETSHRYLMEEYPRNFVGQLFLSLFEKYDS